jgi:hypothetical protein
MIGVISSPNRYKLIEANYRHTQVNLKHFGIRRICRDHELRAQVQPISGAIIHLTWYLLSDLSSQTVRDDHSINLHISLIKLGSLHWYYIALLTPSTGAKEELYKQTHSRGLDVTPVVDTISSTGWIDFTHICACNPRLITCVRIDSGISIRLDLVRHRKNNVS